MMRGGDSIIKPGIGGKRGKKNGVDDDIVKQA